LTISDGTALFSVEGVGSTAGMATYEGSYTTLWVGGSGDGDWPECTGTIEAVIVEPLD
jgi:heme A synthase